jgi:serine phosphatase RsbU (regulator of sigma subunit)
MEPAFERDIRMRERIEQGLRIARLIQQTLLPKTLPELPAYKLSAIYRPARERVIGIIAIWELPRLSYPHG